MTQSIPASTPAPAPGAQRPGGRTARTRQAVLAATRELLVEHGPAGMRIELIAARSGVHRSSIYRRWKTPAGIVADLAHDIAGTPTPPDTGTLAGDLRSVAERLAANLTGDGPALVKNLLAWPDPEVQAHLAGFWQDRHDEVAHLLTHHRCTADPALVTRLLAGPLHYQTLIEGTPVTPATIDAAVTASVVAASPTT